MIPIHTSDRGTFKKCRFLWDFTSPIRGNWQPIRDDKNLTFGTTIHAALEMYYTFPGDELQTVHTLLAFDETWRTYRDSSDDEWEREWQELLELGRQMLRGYFVWAADDRWEVLSVEEKFEIPMTHVKVDVFGRRAMPWSYCGKWDLVVRDENGEVWIIDHKTAARFDSWEWRMLDDQAGSYCWAFQQLTGIRVAGIIFNELRKDYPTPPKSLRDGTLSRDKRQNTTYDLYLGEVRRRGMSETGIHREMLEYLKDNPKEYFRRIRVHKSQAELELLGNRILDEAAEMLSDPRLYPTPGPHCMWCTFRAPCLARCDGSAYDVILSENYKKRD